MLHKSSDAHILLDDCLSTKRRLHDFRGAFCDSEHSLLIPPCTRMSHTPYQNDE